MEFQSGNRRWVGGGVLCGRLRVVVVVGVSGGMIKGMMDGCELCIEAWEELVDFMSVSVGTCDIGSKG